MTKRLALMFATLTTFAASSGLSQSYREPGAEDKARQAKVERLFAEGCKRSGEAIRRTVPDVEGLMLLKLRPTDYSAWKKNSVDPYGYDFDWGYKDRPHPYIGTFLIGKDENGHFQEIKPTVKPGYRYVEAIDQNDGKRYRYTGRIEQPWLRDKRYGEWVREFVVDKAPAPGSPPRYGVTFDDITTEEERDLWIAGSSLKVIDLKTNEVIAERIGYMVDFAQGATPRGRQPWTFARTHKGWSCPPLNNQSYGARRFVERVLLIREAQPIIPPDAAR
jgi:hypothetical protein